ncbi:MAG: hypothetical protein NDI61_03380 [Bdellovibrionaceae bacterium]|nr:hypothetical protein [Pseudobdellovibrionaceae bacterium]
MLNVRVSDVRLVLTGACVALILLFSPASFAGDLVLHSTVMRELNQVVRVADTLHSALVSADDEQIEISVRGIIHQIDRVRTVAILAKQHERPHLLKILESARDHLEVAQVAYGEERRLRLQQAYNQVVNVVRIYKIEKVYGIFFCDRDKSSWVQKGVRGQNPFALSLRKCAVRAK